MMLFEHFNQWVRRVQWISSVAFGASLGGRNDKTRRSERDHRWPFTPDDRESNDRGDGNRVFM